MYNMCVSTIKDYRRALFQANQDLARCLVRRQKIDQKVARLRALINHLEEVCAVRDRKHFENRVERVVKQSLNKGITESARVLLKESSLPMTAQELKESMEARKIDVSRYSNPLAVIHTVLKRLVQSGEVKVVPGKQGGKAYQWVSTTDKLLAELQQSGISISHQQDHPKERK